MPGKKISPYDVDQAADVSAFVEQLRKKLHERVKATSFDRTGIWLQLPSRWVVDFVYGKIQRPGLHRSVYVARCLGIEVKFAKKKSYPPNVSH